jgi:hypothetical protein
MRESERGRGALATSFAEQMFRRRPQGRDKFGRIVLALWPAKPALNLAQRIGCSERAARYLIRGQRKVTARAVAAIVNEMLER